MLPLSMTAVVARNELWQNYATTEPYECGWAKEAIVYLRALKQPVRTENVRARIEFSPDGMRWVDAGLDFALPTQTDEISWISVNQFGNWLRVAVDLPAEAAITVLVSIHLKA